MPQAFVDGETTVDYLVTGSSGPAPDLVLIHGTGGTAESNWGHLIPRLSAQRRVIAPNLAGSGATTDPGGQLELGALVEQVAAAAAHAGSTHYDVAGFSLGAVVGAQLAATHPERVRRLIAVAGWLTSDDGRAQLQFGLWRHLHATDQEALARLLTFSGFSPPFLAKRPAQVVERIVRDTLATLPAGIARQSELDGRVDLTAAAATITAPTLVIGNTDDQMVPVASARALAAAIPGATFAELPSGHLVVFEQPAALTQAIEDFLDASS